MKTKQQRLKEKTARKAKFVALRAELGVPR